MARLSSPGRLTMSRMPYVTTSALDARLLSESGSEEPG
jgi:hypothetical protein